MFEQRGRAQDRERRELFSTKPRITCSSVRTGSESPAYVLSYCALSCSKQCESLDWYSLRNIAKTVDKRYRDLQGYILEAGEEEAAIW